jgi:hypothetical protein
MSEAGRIFGRNLPAFRRIFKGAKKGPNRGKDWYPYTFKQVGLAFKLVVTFLLKQHSKLVKRFLKNTKGSSFVLDGKTFQPMLLQYRQGFVTVTSMHIKLSKRTRMSFTAAKSIKYV